MLDIRRVRENPDELRVALKNRQMDAEIVDEVLKLDEKWRKLKTEADQLKAQKNKVTTEIGDLKKEKKNADGKIKEMQKLNEGLDAIDNKAKELEKELEYLLLTIPNIPHATVPVGKSDADNPVARTWGEPKKFGFKVKEHWELAVEKGWMDFERGAKIAGHRFTIVRGECAELERAVISYFLAVQKKNGYLEVAPPLLVNEKTATGTGNLPKFKEQLYFVPADNLYLIPTAEVPVTNFFADEVLRKEELPIKYCAYTPCFRREAGEYQRDIKGYLRQHQFNKVELVKFAEPKSSYDELEKLTRDAESVLQGLGLPYTVTPLCTGDMGFAAAKTYDINVWLPGQQKYREISSCSNCEDFQARRANIRYRDEHGKPQFVHTLNGSGVAVGRTVIAILENYQNEDGSVTVPEALRPYMGKEKLG